MLNRLPGKYTAPPKPKNRCCERMGVRMPRIIRSTLAKNQTRKVPQFAFVLVPVFVSALFASGCGRVAPMDTGWSLPKVFDTELECQSSLQVYRCNNTVIAFDSNNHRLYSLGEDGVDWEKKSIVGLDGWYTITTQATNDEIILTKSDVLPLKHGPPSSRDPSKDWVEGEIVSAAINRVSGMQILSKKKILLSKEDLFGKTPTNVVLSGFGFGMPVVRERNIQVPYAAMTEVWHGNTIDKAAALVGVFQSEDGGSSWVRTNLFDLEDYTTVLGLFATRANHFLFVDHDTELVYSGRSSNAAFWPPFQTMVPKYRYDGSELVVEGDTLHVCWLRRSEPTLLDQIPPFGESHDYQVFYRNWNDSNNAWSAIRKLSVGLKYKSVRATGLSMSTEGQKIVVAWDCYSSQGHTITTDIDYVVSTDGGQRWSKPKRVTDTTYDRGAHSPEVVLHRNVIHLFYGQDREHSGGNCADIVYQQRAFPHD
jgi:hypothetical protein